ncbi:putative Ig domain-containing protein [Plesiomonas shigelloides]|uniref:putative Ig domain-containing protein n=1 Tax=Plesiomonas shigelloides TaxID=703 RepID=UPI0038B3A252
MSGGTPPYSYAISNGALPDDLALNPATGEISGIPKANGDFNFLLPQQTPTKPQQRHLLISQ